MKKLLAAAAVIAGLGAGVFALSAVLPAGAQTDSSSSSSPDAGPVGPHRPGAKVKSVLDGLVADGTITQDQEDKIVAALRAAAPDERPGPRRGARGALLREGVTTAASALGITVDELKADLRAGRSVADVAAEKGVSLDSVTQALTDAATARIDQAVADGKLTQQRADELKAGLPAAIDRFEHLAGPGPREHGRHGGMAPWGGMGDDGSSSSSSSS